MKLESGWYIQTRTLDGGLRMFLISLSSLTDDAFTHPLSRLLESSPAEEDDDTPPPTEEELAMLEMGLWGSARMRKSLTNPTPLSNEKSTFTRKAFIQIIDPEEATEEHALEACKKFKRFFQLKKNNNYGTKVFIRKPGWNLDVPGAPLPKLDNCIIHSDIVAIIKDMFDGVDGNWAANNLESAMAYFTEGHIPFEATYELGFPADKCQDPGPAVMRGVGGH